MEKRLNLSIAETMVLLAVLLCVAIVFSAHAEAASKKKMYVVTKIDSNSKDFGNTKISYRADGFISKANKSGEYGYASAYKYKNGRISSSTTKRSYGTEKYQMNYKKSRLKKVVMNNCEDVMKFKYKKGKCVSVIHNSSLVGKYQEKYKYNKKGQITYMDMSDVYDSYTYDKKGNMKKCHRFSAEGCDNEKSFKNTYKKGLLKKAVVTEKERRFDGDKVKTFTVKYSYKRINVPKKHVKRIKAQQHRVITDINKYLNPYLAVY